MKRKSTINKTILLLVFLTVAFIPSISLASPDLIVEDVWTEPSTVVEGQSYVIKARIKNQGDTAANVGSSAKQEALFYVDNVQYGIGVEYGNLAPGATLDVQSMPIDESSAGPHTLKVMADGNNAVSESDETNNQKSEDISVSFPQKPDHITNDI